MTFTQWLSGRFGRGGATVLTRPLPARTRRSRRPRVEQLENRNLLSTFGPALSVSTGGFLPRAVAVGDFNGDGHQDLAVAYEGSGVAVLLGDGAGAFQDQTLYASGGGPVAVAVGDFNGDGRPDLAAANADNGTVGVLLGNGSGAFAD